MQLPSIALPRWKLVATIAILSLGIAMLAGVAGFGGPIASMSIILGWFILAPLVALLGSKLPMIESPAAEPDSDKTEMTTTSEPTVDPVDQLRERYARGELTDSEFERRLDRLLETEALSANSEAENTAGETDREVSLETE
ncbi:SHOCT domain-containing protein [Haloarcula hispanica]|uniref:SHOCT domain-containing protein n=1 Tax=Haloarcula hispanica TaxID=51589 RepID=UPI0011B6A34F|nr:SHOCT domain-containing protein [Haloarcula hispanica]